jgi:hypothetical protein
MKTKLTLLLLLFATACTFQVEVLTTPTPATEAVVSPSAVATQSVALELSPTPTALPTFTPTATLPPQTQMPTVARGGVQPIVFYENGTYQSVLNDNPSGADQTYSLKAFKGQVMSISIFTESPNQQDGFQLEIKGADGTVLSPTTNLVFSFWRGVLPSTQEYFITVLPHTSGLYKMQVAINPPGQAHQYFNYADPMGTFHLSASDEFAVEHFLGTDVSRLGPSIALRYIDTAQYLQTNLDDAYFLIGSSTDPQILPKCTEPLSLGGPESVVGTATIDGVSFTKSQAIGVGAGNVYEQIYYRTVYNNTCYEITYSLHYGNIGMYDPNTVHEFDRDAVLRTFDEVLNTVTLP